MQTSGRSSRSTSRRSALSIRWATATARRRHGPTAVGLVRGRGQRQPQPRRRVEPRARRGTLLKENIDGKDTKHTDDATAARLRTGVGGKRIVYRFKANELVDYKDVALLRKFMSDRGKMFGRAALLD